MLFYNDLMKKKQEYNISRGDSDDFSIPSETLIFKTNEMDGIPKQLFRAKVVKWATMAAMSEFHNSHRTPGLTFTKYFFHQLIQHILHYMSTENKIIILSWYVIVKTI